MERSKDDIPHPVKIRVNSGTKQIDERVPEELIDILKENNIDYSFNSEHSLVIPRKYFRQICEYYHQHPSYIGRASEIIEIKNPKNPPSKKF